MSLNFTSRLGICWLVVLSQWSVVNALTPPIGIYSTGNDLKNLSAGNVYAVANQTTFLSSPASKSLNEGPPPSPWYLEIEGTPYAMRFSNFRKPLAYYDVVDIVNEAQFDIIHQIAATDPPSDKPIHAVKTWTSNTVHLTLGAKGRLYHSVCILYLAAILKLWGLDSEYDFHEADMEFVKATRNLPEVPEDIGYGHIGIVGGTAEK